MNITKEQIKETLKLVMNEEADYKVFFKKALKKAGKSIPSMSDDEKKAFFNKIDKAWDAKGEVKEGNAFGAAVTAAKKAGDDEFEVGGEKFKVEESHSDCNCGCGGCSTNLTEGKFKKDDLVYNKRTKTVGIVRLGDDKSGEVKTDADGNVDVDELEKYNPIKNKHQNNAKVAPSTEKEVSKRGLFNPFKNESVVTEAKEDDVIIQLRKIVKDKQNALVVDTKSKKKVRVDMQSASIMVQVYDALKQQSNKDKFVKSGIVAMGHMAYKLMKNEGVNEGDGLWANIRAKKARGEKPAHKNSKAHKDAVKAGNKINKDESVNEAKAFVVMFKVKKNINNKSIKPTSAAYSSEADAKKFLKSVEKDGGNGMIVRSNTSGMKTEANDADTYFKSATQAVEFAKKAVEKKGFTIDEDDWQTQIALGGRYSRLRPSVGKTHSFSVGLIKNGKPQRKGLSISLFGMDSGKFELTHYIN